MRRFVLKSIGLSALVVLTASSYIQRAHADSTATAPIELASSSVVNEKAVALRQQGDAYMKMTDNLHSDANAAKAYQEAANLGDAISQAYVAQRHQTGTVLAFDREKAVHWYARAVEQHNAIAQRSLGLLHVTGQTVAKNDVKAVELFRQSAAQNDAAAQYYLGRMYYRGRGITQDRDSAIEWVRKSAVQGHGIAQMVLSKMILKDETLNGVVATLSHTSCLSDVALRNSANGCRVN